jgi:hypothetical protein
MPVVEGGDVFGVVGGREVALLFGVVGGGEVVADALGALDLGAVSAS